MAGDGWRIISGGYADAGRVLRPLSFSDERRTPEVGRDGHLAGSRHPGVGDVRGRTVEVAELVPVAVEEGVDVVLAGEADALVAEVGMAQREVDGVIRAEGGAGKAGTALFDSIRRVVQSQNSQNVIYDPQTMNEVIADSLARRRSG